MPLQRGEVQGYDFDRMAVEFTMLNQGQVIMCAISTAAMDNIEGTRDVRPDQRIDQFMRLRDPIRAPPITADRKGCMNNPPFARLSYFELRLGAKTTPVREQGGIALKEGLVAACTQANPTSVYSAAERVAP
jgi:hypothetical protein